MSEMTILYIGVVKFFVVLVCAFLYSYAGRDKTSKAWRRFVAPAVLVLGTISLNLIHSRDWKIIVALLAGYPILVGAFSLGYSNKNGWGWFKRTYIALIVIIAYCLLACLSNSWWLVLPASLMCLSTIILGTKNPNEAATEEFLIGALFMFMYPYI